jgi:hypothetical protein
VDPLGKKIRDIWRSLSLKINTENQNPPNGWIAQKRAQTQIRTVDRDS